MRKKNSKSEPKYRKIVRTILSDRKKSIADKISLIKENIDAVDYKKALKIHPLFNKYLQQYPIFKTNKQIYQKEAFRFTGSLKNEFKWAINLLEVYSSIINEFWTLKSKFEVSFLLEDYKEARKILNSIEKEIGINIWTIESNLLLEEFTDGAEANWNKLSQYLNEIPNPFYEFIISESSRRVEKKLPYDSYLSQLQNDLDNTRSSELVKDFLVFKNFNIGDNTYSRFNLDSVFYISNIFSVTDQYSIVIDAIIYVISISDKYDNLFFPFIKKIKDKIPNDFRLVNIYNILNRTNQLLQSPLNIELHNCYDEYYKGNFQLSLDLSEEGVIKHPYEFEYYELYCKSLINLTNEFKEIATSSFINDILHSTYKVLSFGNEGIEHRDRLLKFSLILMNTNLGKQIYWMVTQIEGFLNKGLTTAIISSSANTPKTHLLSDRYDSIASNFSVFSESHSFKVYQYKKGLEVKFLNTTISQEQKDVIKAIHFFNKKNYNEVINIFSNSNITNNLTYYYERKVFLLFESYLANNDIINSLMLYGNVFFDLSIGTTKLDRWRLFEKIKEQGYESCTDYIELPILYSLIVKDEYDIYEVYDEFMAEHEYYNINYIDLDSFIQRYSLKKVIYFLFKVITIDTLKYSTDYGSISEVEEERVSILKTLIKIDNKSKSTYEAEINEIYRTTSVRKALKEVDEGRLFVDIQGLKELQIKKFDKVFERFKEIQVLSSKQNLIGFNASKKRNWETSKNETDKKESFDKADYLAFKNIYLELRDNFLFSKEYGLDSCLSTRIRHGALKNYLRSVFENLNLVTSKSDDKYIDNIIWKQQLQNSPELNNVVQKRLKKFSRDIDNYTVFIVDELIQIRTEKNEQKSQGLFAFYTQDDILLDFYSKNSKMLNSIESTVDLLANQLVNHTLLNVQHKVVEYFQKTIIPKFQSLIEEIIKDLTEYTLPQTCELVSKLKKSSTDIVNILENISNWFHLNTTSSSSLLSIETVIDASIELTNKIHPKFQIHPYIDFNCEPFGVYSSLVFVFNILLTNIIEHSHLKASEVNANIRLSKSEDEKFYIVVISNNVCSKYDFADNIKKLTEIKNEWNNHQNIERSNKEVGSGFAKIKRILIYETFSKTEKFDFLFEDNIISIKLYFPCVKLEE